MTSEQQKQLDSAQKSLRAAKSLLENGFAGYSAARSYYAMFYCATALLEGLGLAFSKHSAVNSAFGKEFVHSGKVDAKYHQFLSKGHEIRQLADYLSEETITEGQAQTQIDRAEEFLKMATLFISNSSE